jgi:secreted PhoX family phosphatase
MIIEFDHMPARVMSRRGFLSGGLAFGAATFMIGSAMFRPAAARASKPLDFEAVPANTLTR